MVCGRRPIIDRPQKCTVYGYQPITCGPRWYNVLGRLCRELFWDLKLLLFGYTLKYLDSDLGNAAAKHYLRSSTCSNIQASDPKVGSATVRNNQYRPHPHECRWKVIIADPLWKGYKWGESIRKRGWTIEGTELQDRVRPSEEAQEEGCSVKVITHLCEVLIQLEELPIIGTPNTHDNK